jgi:putative glutamine amidotransferase
LPHEKIETQLAIDWARRQISCENARTVTLLATEIAIFGRNFLNLQTLDYLEIDEVKRPIVAVSSDVKPMDNYRWHATPEQYLKAALLGACVMPLILPSFGEEIDFDELLDQVNGVLITGSKSNVHPDYYGGEATEENGPYDRDRDATTLPLIRRAIARGIPLLAICRGIQELNVALGGTLATEIQKIEGFLDHRAPQSDHQHERFAVRQKVEVDPDSCIARYGIAGPVIVNSLHRQAIGELAEGLVAEATAPDGVIEAVSVRDARGFAIGVQWHPEYWYASDETSRKIFGAFGDAVRAHAKTRRMITEAAE